MKNTISGSPSKAFMKIVVAADTDFVVGVHIVGPECADIIQARPPFALLPGALAELLYAQLLCRPGARGAVSASALGCGLHMHKRAIMPS